jgi:glycosyltransferase involved in cell wall biosynthesis
VKVLLFANTDWYLYNFRLSLARFLRENGYEVVLLSPPGRYAKQMEQAGFKWLGLPLQRDGTNPFVELATILRLFGVFRKNKPGIVHFFTVKAVLYGSIAAKLARVPQIINSIEGLGIAFSDSRPWLRMIVILLYRLSIRGTRVIFQNTGDQDVFLKYKLANPEQCTMSPGSGVDVKLFGPSPEPPGRPVVMLAGRLLRSKGAPLFAAAAQVLHEGGSDARFVLVGEPYPDNPDTVRAEEIERWREAGILEAWGWHDDMHNIIPQAAIVCLPTTYNEGLPRTLLEASACQRPVIATDIPGCRLAVRDGETGLLIPPDDVHALVAALQTLLGDPALRQSMGINGRKLVEREFSLEKTLKHMLQVYRESAPVR